MPARGPVRRSRRAHLLAALTLVVSASACTGGADDPSPAPSDVPLSEVELSGLTVRRASFCEAVDEKATGAALGGEATRSDRWASGDRRRLEPGLRDVAHEYGCSWARGPVVARAWVFAQPVTAAQARRLVTGRAQAKGCRPAGVLEFGEPGSIVTCPAGPAARPAQRVSLAGLFGDGWLTCEVTRPATQSDGAGPDRVALEDALEGAQRWCGGVVGAAAD